MNQYTQNIPVSSISSGSSNRHYSQISIIRNLIRDGQPVDIIDNYLSNIQSTFPEGVLANILNSLLGFSIENGRDDLIDLMVNLGGINLNTALNTSMTTLVDSINDSDFDRINQQLIIIKHLLRLGADNTVIINDILNLQYQQGNTVLVDSLYNILVEDGILELGDVEL